MSMFLCVRQALRAQTRRPVGIASMSTLPDDGAKPLDSVIQELLHSGPSAQPSAYEAPAPSTPIYTPSSTPESYVDQPPQSTSSNPIADAQKAKVTASRVAPLQYLLHVFASRNNTRMSFHRAEGGYTLARASGGTCKFKGVNRSTYEAGYQVAVRMFEAVAQEKRALGGLRSMQIELIFKGFGQGRDAMYRGLLTAEGEHVKELITRVTDRTPIKIGGTRAKKARRI